MGTVDLGKISFTQKGTYDNSTSYAVKDVVQHTDQNETSSFVKINSTATGQVPQTNGTINSSHWSIFAKGTSLATPNQGTYDASTTYSKGAVVQYTDSGVLSTFLYINNTPASGQTPSTGGTVNSSHWQLIAKGTAAVAVSWQSSPKTANFTAQANEGYFIDTSGGAFTMTTPSSPSTGDEFIWVDYGNNFGTNNLTIAGNGSDKIMGDTADFIAGNAGSSMRMVYTGSTKGWIPVSSSESNDTTIGAPYNVQYLVVGGGAGGGGDNGGGGGAGGFRTVASKNFQVVKGVSYAITVGDGGVGGSNNPSTSPTPNSGLPQGESGGNSVFSTITSAGGGGGGSSGATGNAGGSGGGGGQNASGGAGNTPSTSPSQGNNGGTSTSGTGGGAGGGGAGAAGSNTSGGGSNGGAGTASSISGSSVTRAGGGGGGEDQNTSGNNGSGGSGGGGNGGGSANTGSPGSNNTGGGGGGGGQSGTAIGGTGGSGIVIIRRLTSDSNSTSGTVTTDGSDTIHTFTSSGTFIA
tara:strand:+ start:888 stop:2450 length:1563 start_codon:yes stop_codon:yes gene_type:complete